MGTKTILLEACLDYLINPTVDISDISWCRLEQYLINIFNLHTNLEIYLFYLPTELREHLITIYKLKNVEFSRIKINEIRNIEEVRLQNKDTLEYIDDLLIARLLFN